MGAITELSYIWSKLNFEPSRKVRWPKVIYPPLLEMDAWISMVPANH